MARQLAIFLVGLVVLYALAAAGFAFGHYEGSLPGVGQVLDDFHGWLGEVFVGREAPARVPSQPPARTSAGPAAPAARATLEAPPQAPLDEEGQALLKIEKEVLPAAMKRARALRGMSRADADAFERERAEVLAALSETRPLLNAILERDSSHAKANRLWSQMQELYSAVKKL
ncbi:MAG: hypothetical protein ACKOSS_07350 [Planctomycetia bacterium]